MLDLVHRHWHCNVTLFSLNLLFILVDTFDRGRFSMSTSYIDNY